MNGKTAFVIDDDPGQLQLNALRMRMAGYDVTGFETVDEALETMGAAIAGAHVTRPVDPALLPDIVITDNDTFSKGATLKGTQLVEALHGTGCGAILSTGDYIEPDLLARLNPHAIHYDKSQQTAKELPTLAEKAITQARATPDPHLSAAIRHDSTLAPSPGKQHSPA